MSENQSRSETMSAWRNAKFALGRRSAMFLGVPRQKLSMPTTVAPWRTRNREMLDPIMPAAPVT